MHVTTKKLKLLNLKAIQANIRRGKYHANSQETIALLVAENRALRTSLQKFIGAARYAIDWCAGTMVGHEEAQKLIRAALDSIPQED
jgi:hypothetical protein